MPKEEIKNAIRKLADDPGSIQALLDKDKAGRKAGLQSKGVPGFNRKEVEDEIRQLLTQSQGAGGTGASSQRVVEWVAAVATLAAGALAA